MPQLPNHYTIVPPVDLGNDDIFCPAASEGNATPSQDRIPGAISRDEVWLDHVHKMMEKEDVGKDDIPIMWPG